MEQGLDRALRAANIPILGVSIGSESDRATWRIDYTEDADKTDRIAGDAVLAAFDPLAPATVDAEIAEKATATSLEGDVLAMCALIVRSRDLKAWDAMTVKEQVVAVQAESAAWATIRAFIEKNL